MAEGDERSTHPKPLHARDWNGKDDPENPRNFSLSRRVFATVAGSALAFVTTFAASIYSPGSDQVAQEFHVSEEVSILPLALYNLGLAAGPLIGSPLSETYGRKVVVLVTTPIFALFTLGAGFSDNFASLVICRFLAGAFAAPAVGNAAATITDYTAGRYRGISMAFYFSIPTFGASLGPVVGGFVVQSKGWRWTQWTTLFFTIAFYVPICFTKETYKKIILQRRAKKLQIEGPPVIQRTLRQSIHYFAATLLFRPMHMLFTEPIVTLTCLYNGFLFGLLYIYITAMPWIFENYYNFDQSAVSLSFLGLAVGSILVPIPLILVDTFMYQPRLARFSKQHAEDEKAQFAPEHRLYPAMIAAFALPTALLVFAWTVRPTIHWICPIVFQALTMTSNLMIYAPANTYMIDSYGPLYGASAGGAAMISRYTFSAAFSLFGPTMYKRMGVGWATSLLAFLALALAPVPFLFYKTGEKMRAKTKYETSL